MGALEANLNTIARGGAGEIFERELLRVVENIKDINTDPKKKRKITLTFDCTPYPDRSGFNVDVVVKTNLQAQNGVAGTVYIGRIGPKFHAFTQDIRQGDLFNGDKPEEGEAEQAAPETAASGLAN